LPVAMWQSTRKSFMSSLFIFLRFPIVAVK
jgi:hypothetical protein